MGEISQDQSYFHTRIKCLSISASADGGPRSPSAHIRSFGTLGIGGRLTDKGQQIDRFLQFTSQTDKKTD
jgi:hypothetical protein